MRARWVEAVVAVGVAIGLAACAAGVPPGFSDGTSWTIPVVGGLDDGPLVAPVFINDEGPFLFVLNPRAASTIDPELARNLDIWVDRTDQKIVSFDDKITHEKLDIADILKVRVGTLTVVKTKFLALPARARYHGQRVWGTIGKEIFAESLIWTIDRDRQQVHVATQGHQPVPDGATKVTAKRLRANRLFVDVRLDGKTKAYVFVDPCRYGSGVWPKVAARAGLDRRGGHWVAAVTLAGLEVADVPIYAYEDKRVRTRDWDGMLGMEFFAKYHVIINWHEHVVWLTPRAPSLRDGARMRIERWGPSVATCDTLGCVSGTLTTDGDRTTLAFERDAAITDAAMEAVFEAVDADGRALRLRRIIVSFPRGARTAAIRGAVLNQYAHAAGLSLVDVTPFAPPCDTPRRQGCVYLDR